MTARYRIFIGRALGLALAAVGLLLAPLPAFMAACGMGLWLVGGVFLDDMRKRP